VTHHLVVSKIDVLRRTEIKMGKGKNEVTIILTPSFKFSLLTLSFWKHYFKFDVNAIAVPS
jgi:hypothetical protein